MATNTQLVRVLQAVPAAVEELHITFLDDILLIFEVHCRTTRNPNPPGIPPSSSRIVEQMVSANVSAETLFLQPAPSSQGFHMPLHVPRRARV